MAHDVLVLSGRTFHSQTKIAKDRGVSSRKVARDREKGVAWLDYGGHVYIEPLIYDNFILKTHSRGRNPPRTRGRYSRLPPHQPHTKNSDSSAA
jgi:hypothetical protein